MAAIATADPVSAGTVPGGVGGGDLPSIFRTADISPVVLLVSILTAAALGAGHALTPGHGKTLMAAYLVGTRGTPLHAAGLGLSVTVSHTLGILVLAALIVGAEGVLSPDLVVTSAPVVAADLDRGHRWLDADRRGASPLARSNGRTIARRSRMPTATPMTTRTNTTTTTTTTRRPDTPSSRRITRQSGASTVTVA